MCGPSRGYRMRIELACAMQREHLTEHALALPTLHARSGLSIRFPLRRRELLLAHGDRRRGNDAGNPARASLVASRLPIGRNDLLGWAVWLTDNAWGASPKGTIMFWLATLIAALASDDDDGPRSRSDWRLTLLMGCVALAVMSGLGLVLDASIANGESPAPFQQYDMLERMRGLHSSVFALTSVVAAISLVWFFGRRAS